MTVQALAHSLIRVVSYACFIRLPYGRVRRIGKPDLTGRVILAPTHNNFYCDISIAGTEPPRLPRWMAKVGLFRPPFDKVMHYLGAFPIVRILDGAAAARDARGTNKATFDSVARALEKEGGFCIFPEGNCLDRPGLNLPLKNGIAKLAFEAESLHDSRLGLRIVPMGIDYRDRTSFASGVTVRYAEAIRVDEFAAAYREDPRVATKALMARLTDSLLGVFPHFDTYEEAECARLLEKLAIEEDRLAISHAFARAKAEGGNGLRDLQNTCIEFYRAFSPGTESVIGNARRWESRGFFGRLQTYFLLIALWPLAAFSFGNNFIASRALRLLTKRFSEATPDHMTVYVALSAGVIPVVYLFQYVFVGSLFGFDQWPAPLGYFAYFTLGIASWMAEQRWRSELPFAWANFLVRSGIARNTIRAAYATAAKVEAAFSAICGKRRESSPGPSA